jgi:GNAT superfamily N-acetyltransferase
VIVRDAVPEDAEAMALVHVQTWQAAYAHVFPAERLAALSAERRAENWRGWIATPEPQTHRFVAEDDEGVCGIASLGPARDDEPGIGELYAIYVLPRAWGTGAGRELMAAAVERLREEGFREAILWVLEDNPRARRFYERAGWRHDGGVMDGTFLDTTVSEVRYRVGL